MNGKLFKKSVKPWICWSITSWFSLLAWIFSMRSSRRLLFPLNNITLMLAHGTRGATDCVRREVPWRGPPPWAPIGRGAGSPLPPLTRHTAPRRATYCCQQWREIGDSAGMNRFRSVGVSSHFRSATGAISIFSGVRGSLLNSFDGISPPWYQVLLVMLMRLMNNY